MVAISQESTSHANPEPWSNPERLLHPTRTSSVLLLGVDIAALGGSAALFRWTLVRGSAFAGAVIVILLVRGHYRTRMARKVPEDASLLLGAIAGAVLAIAIGVTVLGVIEPQLSTLVVAALGTFVVLMVSRWLAFSVLVRLRRSGRLRSRAVVLGTGVIAREIGAEFGHRLDYGVDIAGYVSRPGRQAECKLPGPVIGDIDGLADLLRITGSDRLIVTLGPGNNGGVVDALRGLTGPSTSIFVMPQLFELGLGSDAMTPDAACGFALVRLGRSAHPVLGMKMKRVFDIFAGVMAMLTLSPVLLGAALAVRLSSRGPILFRQTRVGKHGVEFDLVKFRSMSVNSDSDSSWTPDGSTSEVTRVGRFLRWSSIDELPQLWNIVKGDMSVVGPRPERPAFVQQFLRTVPGYAHRHRLPVGLTGSAQVRGLRGDTPIAERVKHDNLYIDQWSFFGDMALIARTIGAIIRQSAYAEAQIDLSEVLSEVDAQEQVVVDLVAVEREEAATPLPAHESVGSPSA